MGGSFVIRRDGKEGAVLGLFRGLHDLLIRWFGDDEAADQWLCDYDKGRNFVVKT